MNINFSKYLKLISSNKLYLVYTIIIFINHVGFGISWNLIGASLVDLHFIYNVSIDMISYLTVAIGGGYLLGALVGWFYRWINRQLTMALAALLMSLTIAFVPHYPQFWTIIVALTLNGIASGAWDSSVGFWIVEMWPEASAGMLCLHQFMYGAGSVAGPLLGSPFLKGQTMVVDGKNLTSQDRSNLLTVPFLVNGSIHLVAPISLLILFFTHRYKTKAPAQETTKVIDNKVKDIPNRILKLALCGACLGIYGAAEVGWFNFSATMYQYLDIELDVATAAKTQSILSATYTAGRLATAFITVKVLPDYIISYHYVIILGGLATLFFGRDSQTAIFVGSAVLGWGFSSMWPSLYSLTERHLRLSVRVYSVFSFLAGIGYLLVPLVLGQTFHSLPMMLFILEFILLVLSLIIFISLRLWIAVDSKRKL